MVSRAYEAVGNLILIAPLVEPIPLETAAPPGFVIRNAEPFRLAAVPLSKAVIVPALKSPFESRATIALAVFALVALDVTVNVELPDWLAVKVCEPDRPVPDTFIVRVPLFTFDAVVAVEALPFKAAVIVPAVKLPEASRATIVEAVFKFVALVASVTAVEPL